MDTNYSLDVVTEIESLIKKAETAEKADDALKFSQAANNATNAMACVNNIKKQVPGLN